MGIKGIQHQLLIENFEKIKGFFASNITLVLRFMICKKFCYTQTAKVVN